MQVEEFIDGFGFSPLTENYISQNPDYKQYYREGLYKLIITSPERYNGTQYRCFGYLDEDLSVIDQLHSSEWNLTVTCKLNQFSCAFNNYGVQQYGCHYA